MTGITAVIFFDVLAHAAISVLWGLLIAVGLSSLIIVVIRGLYSRAEVTPLGWLGMAVYCLLTLALATMMVGAMKLNSAVAGAIDAVAGGGAVDIPSWIASYLGDIDSCASVATDSVIALYEELSSSLKSTVWKMLSGIACISVFAIAIGCHQASKAQSRRLAPGRSRPRQIVDDF